MEGGKNLFFVLHLLTYKTISDENGDFKGLKKGMWGGADAWGQTFA